jgi:hypothetical protein
MYPLKFAASDYKMNSSFSCSTEQVRTLISRLEVPGTIYSDWDFFYFLQFLETSARAFK